jgi:anti-anti-sigma regulatory factor
LYYATLATFLDKPELRDLETGLEALCRHAASANKRIIADFRGVNFLSSGMIGHLVILHKIAKEERADLRFANACRSVLEVFQITRINKVIQPDDEDGTEFE